MLSSSPSSSSLRKRFEQLVECCICLEQLNDPRVLPCLHTCCYKCITQLAEKSEIGLTCPECRVVVELGNPPDVSSLPSNFFVNNVLATLALNDENQDTTTSCDNCDESQTFETRCQDCGKFLCHYCTEFHRRCRESRSHVLLSKIELKSNKPADNARILNCVKHKENIKFYCKTCQMTSCMVCTVVDHRSHEVSSVEESACDAKSELKQLAENVKAMGNRATESIENLKEEARNINASNQNAYDEINSFFKDLEKEIENQRAKLIKKAISSINHQKEQLQASTRNLETLRDACCSGVKFAEEALEHGSDVQVLRMKNTIAQRLKSLKFDKDEKKPWVGKPIRFSNHCSLEDVRNIITELCFVEDVVACPEESLAYFKDSGRFLHVGERSVVEIVLKDKNGEIIRSGTGRNRIESSFSGVQVSDVRVAESEKGFHDISFVANQVGTLKFEAKINGSLSLGCCLENDSKWLLSCTHGCGQILNGGHTMIGEGDIGKYCYRLGDWGMAAGIHKWKIEISRVVENKGLPEGAAFEVGVIEDNDDYSEESIKSGKTRKWVYSGHVNNIQYVLLELDMEKKQLMTRPAGRKFSFRPSIRRKTNYEVKSEKVFPFLSVSCPDCYLTVTEMQNT